MKEILRFSCLYQHYIPQDIPSLIPAELLHSFLQYTLSRLSPQISVLAYFPFHFLQTATDVLLD